MNHHDIKGNPKIINAWATYDLANSVYNLVITATIFPIYYNAVTSTKDEAGHILNDTVQFLGFSFKNTALYEYAIAFAYMLVALLSPLLSGIADYAGTKKKFMQFFCYLGASSCALMYFFDKDHISLGIILAILACIGFSGSLVFYNAYLPEIAAPAEQDRVSAKGFAMGYWGSSILLIFNLLLVQKPEWFGIESKGMATKIAFLTVGLWWAGFAQIPFYFLPNQSRKNDEGNINPAKGYHEIIKVWHELKKTHSSKDFYLHFLFIAWVYKP